MPLGLILLGALVFVNVSGFSILISQTRRVMAGQHRIIGLLAIARSSRHAQEDSRSEPWNE